jgi:hypothetical protein
MDFPYNPNINKKFQVAGFDFFELLLLLMLVTSVLVFGKIMGILVPIVGTIFQYISLIILLVGIPFLRFGNKQSYKGFLLSFIGFAIQKKRLIFLYKDFLSYLIKKKV